MTERMWYVLEVVVKVGMRDLVIAALSEFPITGMEEDVEREDRLVAISAQPWDQLRVMLACTEVGLENVWLRTSKVPDEDWLALWKRDWKPTPLGERLVAVPAWWTGDLPTHRVPVRIDPGRAFGTGTHATTALAWSLLERCLDPAPDLLLDVGTGSGLLALGALALTPGLRAVGTELDPDALPSLAANLDLTPHASRFLPVRAAGLPVPSARFPLVVANMTSAELVEVEAELVRVLSPDGKLIAGGYLTEQVSEGIQRWKRLQLNVLEAPTLDGWTTLLLSRSPVR